MVEKIPQSPISYIQEVLVVSIELDGYQEIGSKNQPIV